MKSEILFFINSYSAALFGSYDVDFTGAVSEIEPVTAEARPVPDRRAFALTFGKRIMRDEQRVIYLFSKGGNQDTRGVLSSLQAQPDLPLNRVHGYVLLVDSRPTTGSIAERIYGSGQKTEGWFCVEQAKEEIQVLHEIAPDKPYVIAVVNQHLPNAMPLDKIRETLKLDANTKVLPCNPKDRQSVIDVLLKLLEMCPPSPTVQRMIETFEHLD